VDTRHQLHEQDAHEHHCREQHDQNQQAVEPAAVGTAIGPLVIAGGVAGAPWNAHRVPFLPQLLRGGGTLESLSSGLSPSTVHHLHATLHKALKDAERLELVARNVCKLVNAPRMAETEIHPLSREDARAFLDVASRERLEALYVVALATGMRQSELLGLRWEDVDLDEGLLRVRIQLKREDGKWVWKQPKTRRSRRQIALAAPVVEVLRSHRERQEAECAHVGAAWRACDLVFCNTAGGPLFARNLVRSFMLLLEKAAVPRIRFHDLRHTAATLLLSARVNPKVVSEMLGHASVSIALDIYSHVIPDMQQDAAAAMAKLLYE
jgi:integrase